MSKEHQVEPTQEPSEPNITQEPTQEPTPEQVAAEIEAKLEAKYKTQIDGLNRAVSKVTKERDEERKAKMTEEEKAQAEIAELKAEKERERQELIRVRQERIIDTELASVGLPLDFAKYISGESDEEIKESVQGLFDYINKTANELKETEINKRLSGKGPGSGASPDVSDLQSRYNEAKKNNDTATMVAIKRRAKLEGVVIT